jgi:hypothetical protein
VLLNRRTFFVKERVALIKLTDTYDILDPESGQPIGVAREEPPGWAKYARIAIDKRILPTQVNIYEDEGSPPTFSLKKGPRSSARRSPSPTRRGPRSGGSRASFSPSAAGSTCTTP